VDRILIDEQKVVIKKGDHPLCVILLFLILVSYNSTYELRKVKLGEV
jgi:hypothetical protein